MRRLALLALLALLPLNVFAQEEHAKEAESSSGIEVDPLWKWANFALLAAGLGYLMAKTLPPAFKSRTQAIQKDIAAAQQTKREADQRAADMEARLKSLGTEIENFRTQAADEMRKEGERIRQDTAVQIKRLEAQATVEIESAGKAARRELKQQAADLALKLAEERIRTRMDSGAEGVLIDKFVAELGRDQGARN